MISIIKGITPHQCHICHGDIEKGELKIKDNQDNTNRKYYHLGCCPVWVIDKQLQLWTLALQESRKCTA